MPEKLSVIFIVAASLAIIGMAVSFIFTSFRTKKVKCPQCGAKTPVAVAFYTHEATGQKVQGEPDIPFALVAAAARMLIGIIAIVYVFVLLLSALGYESCDLQGIAMVCTDDVEGAGMSVNLVYSLLGIVGGVIVLFNGALRMLRALHSRDKKMTYEYICAKNHRWTE